MADTLMASHTARSTLPKRLPYQRLASGQRVDDVLNLPLAAQCVTKPDRTIK